MHSIEPGPLNQAGLACVRIGVKLIKVVAGRRALLVWHLGAGLRRIPRGLLSVEGFRVTRGVLRAIELAKMPARLPELGNGFIVRHDATIIAHGWDQRLLSIDVHGRDGAVVVLDHGTIIEIDIPRLQQASDIICHHRTG
ncbi:hypothetical protein XH94_32570 [Bradyrhizobium zhanjiangense]|uniref:Uncharacterized protein n=1 Tax=Bradyrhizobium zhanjiangense TaxID=1325107 RepID=A0A4Q0S7U4_9BRAD|nr:hypothetical protein XH94_32570 [Bradyrhizobium zhanjiangense]